jgi:gamma-glutamylcyclotransferase (GGCT)/AIG2-like uncharacterized protein YtfP
VLVYGTLRAGERNDIAKAAASVGLAVPACVGTCWVRGHLHDLGRYPGLVWAADGPPVVAEVYPLLPRLEAKLDEIESLDPAAQGGASDEYAKHRVLTPWGEALVYLMNPRYAKGHPAITGGDWVAYRRAHDGRLISPGENSW